MAVTGVASLRCDRDGSMVAVQFRGDLCGFPSQCLASFPAPIGLLGGRRCGASSLVWSSVWLKPRMGASSRLQMREVDGDAFPVSVPTICGRLSSDHADFFSLEISFDACDNVLSPGWGSLWVEVLIWSLPVMARPDATIGGSLVLLHSFFSEAFISFSLLMRFVCVFSYFFCSRKISEGWIDCYSQAMGADQLVWVCVQAIGTDQLVWGCFEGGDPAVVILPVSWCRTVCYCQAKGTNQLGWVCAAFQFPAVVIMPVSYCWIVCQRGRHSQCGFSAVCSFDYFNFVFVSCILFSASANPRGLVLHGFCSGCHALCGLSFMMRWRTITKWLLPPSVKMKKKAIRDLFGYYWLHNEEIKLLNILLCLFVGCVSSDGSCYFKTDRVAACALSVFRRKLDYLYFIETPAFTVGTSLYALFVLGFRLYVPPLYLFLLIVVV